MLSMHPFQSSASNIIGVIQNAVCFHSYYLTASNCWLYCKPFYHWYNPHRIMICSDHVFGSMTMNTNRAIFIIWVAWPIEQCSHLNDYFSSAYCCCDVRWLISDDHNRDCCGWLNILCFESIENILLEDWLWCYVLSFKQTDFWRLLFWWAIVNDN